MLTTNNSKISTTNNLTNNTQGACRGAPKARQVADRFHLLKNLRETIERQLSRSFSEAKVSAAPADSTSATMEAPADRNSHGRQPDLQRHRLLAREGRRALWLERFDRVKALQHEGRSLTAIAKETSLNWRTVAKWTELRELLERRSMNPKSTTPRKYETYLAQRWAEGFRTGRHLLPEIKKLGYTGSLTHLERLLSEWRRSGRGPCLASLDPDAGNRSSLAAMPVPPIAPSYLCLKPRGLMTSQELATTTELKRAAPAFATIRQLAMRFRGILHGRDPDKLESWLDDAHRSGLYGLRRFADPFKCRATVVESCRRLKIPVRDYMAAVMPGLSNTSIQCVAYLTPTAWAASHR